MSVVLVTGSQGQLATCLKDLTQSDNLHRYVFAGVNELDISNSKEVAAFFQTNTIDYCINCAAYTAVDLAESNEELAFAVNVKGAEHLALACKGVGAKLIHISTDFVFDGAAISSYDENEAPNPLGVYGKTKLAGEVRIEQILKEHFIIRTSWLYSEYGSNFLKTMLRLEQERDHLSVVSDQMGSPTYAKDLAKILIEIVHSNSENFGIYHYSNEGKTSWYGFAKAIFEEQGLEVHLSPIGTEGYPTPAVRPKFSVLSTSKIKATFSIEIPHWKDGLKRALKNLGKH